MSSPDYCRNSSGLQVADISMHLPHPLASAFEYVARAGLKTTDAAEDLEKALRWLEIERKRRAQVHTQGHDAANLALPLCRRWIAGKGRLEQLRGEALVAIVETACNWMHPDLLQRAREAVIVMRDGMHAATKERGSDLSWQSAFKRMQRGAGVNHD